MQQLRSFWQSGWIGKVVLSAAGLFGLLVVCCVALVAFVPRTSTTIAPTAAPAAAQPTTFEVDPTTAPLSSPTPPPEPTEVPRPTAAPEPTTARPTSTPRPTRTPAPTNPPVAAEPSRGLGMSRAAWEAKAGPPVGKGVLGPTYKNGVEATFIDDKLWRIDYNFAESNYPSPSDAHEIGKAFIPDDAKLVETYQRDVTTVNLYHSNWLSERFGADSFTGGKPGDFTLQYNVFDGRAHSFIIALGNNP